MTCSCSARRVRLFSRSAARSSIAFSALDLHAAASACASDRASLASSTAAAISSSRACALRAAAPDIAPSSALRASSAACASCCCAVSLSFRACTSCWDAASCCSASATLLSRPSISSETRARSFCSKARDLSLSSASVRASVASTSRLTAGGHFSRGTAARPSRSAAQLRAIAAPRRFSSSRAVLRRSLSSSTCCSRCSRFASMRPAREASAWCFSAAASAASSLLRSPGTSTATACRDSTSALRDSATVVEDCS
mmetsp:Transcript_36201/g.80547  ORF Transcript_36201/g.80547 Transcript_36201/m.80547 type:complete len:256 (-) Transcript_36201:450-1217(-)